MLGEYVYFQLNQKLEYSSSSSPCTRESNPSREELLEYDLTRIIHRLQTSKKKVVGIISTLPVFGPSEKRAVPGRPLRGRPWFFITEMRKSYEVQQIDLSPKTFQRAVNH